MKILVFLQQSVVVTICPPAGTNAINKIALAHIPDAINSVDSAPSSALLKYRGQVLIKCSLNSQQMATSPSK